MEACGVRQCERTTGHPTPNAEAMPICNMLPDMTLADLTTTRHGPFFRQRMPVARLELGTFCRSASRANASVASVPRA
jgi:hypothetical protein